jgi:hypothetical protein
MAANVREMAVLSQTGSDEAGGETRSAALPAAAASAEIQPI